MPELWKESIFLPIYKKGNKRDCSNFRGIHFANYVRNFIQHFALKVNYICRGNYWGPSM